MSHNCEEFDKWASEMRAAGYEPPRPACSNHNALRQQPNADDSGHREADRGDAMSARDRFLLEHAPRWLDRLLDRVIEREYAKENAKLRLHQQVLIAENRDNEQLLDAMRADIRLYRAMVASEHELLNGIIREGETPLDAIRRVVAERDLAFRAVRSFDAGHNTADDEIRRLEAENERLRTALSRDVVHREVLCPCEHSSDEHTSVLFCRGCVAKP